MDGGVSSAAVEVLVQNLIDLIKQEYSLVRGLDEDAKQLQTTLCMIQAYLSDAEKKSIAQDAVKIWLRDLEALAFDADNVLDELSYHLLHKKFKKMTASKNKVPSFLLPFKHITRRRSMAHAIKQINMDFESMNRRATELGVQRMIENAPTAAPHASFETDSLTLDPIFIGRDEDLPKLVDSVIGSPHERKFSIHAIVGMGGLGKTTLTREVFHHEKIKTRFGSLIWVHVSQDFDPILLFKKILPNLTSYTPDGVESREVVLKKLKEAFKDKTYLLVLDDVWNEDPHKWGDFMNSMSAVTSTWGNAIVMSSRKEGVASMVRPLHTHYPSVLSDDDCWSIIKAKAFENGEAPSPGFEMIGREIAERCKGLPLAANVVGGLLLGKSEEEWRIIKENRLSDVEGGERIRKILKLSYDHLASPSLKKCFAYCSIFPKGHQIEKQVLIEMWMAEGFLKTDGRNEEMESVGDKFVNILLHNSLLLVSGRDKYGNVSKCVMHDLVHDVASNVLGYADGITPLRYTMNVSGDEANRIPKHVAKHLRTLVIKGDITNTVFSDFESLRVLTLPCYGSGDKLPSSIRKLIHLRFLDISKTWISNLPEWIGELHHLQTLRADRISKWPRTLEYLTNLINLYINTSDIVSYDTRTKLLVGIGKFSGLRTLDYFGVRNENGRQIEELGSLNNLKGKLEIWNLEKVGGREEAEKANMSHKQKLMDLELIWSDDREEGEMRGDNDERVLEGLQPHPNLINLEINGYKGKKFPSWGIRDGLQQEGSWVGLNKLTEIRLDGCSECEEIPRLDHLPNLKSLYLEGLKKVKVINSSFTKLTSLFIYELEGLECLPDWLFYSNPNLSELEIRMCPKLTELPGGLRTLDSLENLQIRNCPNLKSIIGNNNNNENEAWKSQGRVLIIEGCESMRELPRGMVESWASSLEVLSLKELSSLENLPMLMDSLSKSPTALGLTQLSIKGVPKLRGSSTSIETGWDLGSLESLEISVDCGDKLSSDGIKETVDGILRGCSSNSIRHLGLQGMEDWESIPESIQHLTALHNLELENFGMEELPEWLRKLSSLRNLTLKRCNKLRRLPPAGNAPARLRVLNTTKECPQLQIDSEWLNIPNLWIL